MSNDQKSFVVNFNDSEMQKRDIKKIEILFDLNGESYQIEDKLHDKSFVCQSGSCCLVDAKNVQAVTLNEPDANVYVPKNISLEIVEYSKDSRIVITYYKDEICE